MRPLRLLFHTSDLRSASARVPETAEDWMPDDLKVVLGRRAEPVAPSIPAPTRRPVHRPTVGVELRPLPGT